MMRKDYKPDYAPGEILVCPQDRFDLMNKHGLLFSFEPDLGEGFFRNIGSTQGYLLKGEYELLDGVLLFNVPVGQELDAVRYFNSLKVCINISPSQIIPAVGWAERRDLRWERRHDSLGELSTLVESLTEKADEGLSSEQYNRYLDRVKSYIDRIKENDYKEKA